MLWLHLLKLYCRSLTPTNLISALLCWFAENNFELESWRLFVKDLCIIANITEGPSWKKGITKNKESIPSLLNKTIFPFYWYLYYLNFDLFLNIFVEDMVSKDEKKSFYYYIKSLPINCCEPE